MNVFKIYGAPKRTWWKKIKFSGARKLIYEKYFFSRAHELINSCARETFAQILFG